MATQRQILDAYNRISTRLVNGTGDRLANIFRGLDNWRDEDFEKLLPLIENTLSGAKLQSARLQTEFYKQMAELRNEAFRQPTVRRRDLSTESLRNGTSTREAYRRPFIEVYTAIAANKSISEAIEQGARRMQSLASTDVQLARRNAGLLARNGNGNIVGYVRTLTGAENCALCTIASTQRYTRGDLMPIHPGCDCGEMPIYGNEDPGQVIDEVRLDQTYDSIEQELQLNPDFGARDAGLGKVINSPTEGQKLADYTEIVVTSEHGEYGPTLRWRDQSFTGPSDL